MPYDDPRIIGKAIHNFIQFTLCDGAEITLFDKFDVPQPIFHSVVSHAGDGICFSKKVRLRHLFSSQAPVAAVKVAPNISFRIEEIPMSMTLRTASTVALAALAIAACDRLPGGPSTVVVDLAAVAKATGQDVAMQKQMEDGRNELTAQLQEVAANLEKELNEQRDNLGESPTDAEQQSLQQKITEAQQQYSQSQAAAQQQVQQFEAGLVLQYRESLQPIVREIAKAHGASVVRLTDTSLIWFDPEVDITAEVIAAVRAQAPTAAAESAPPSAAVTESEPAAAAAPEINPQEIEPAQSESE
jgi:Skp family chaperone for outer membrane proteins